MLIKGKRANQTTGALQRLRLSLQMFLVVFVTLWINLLTSGCSDDERVVINGNEMIIIGRIDEILNVEFHKKISKNIRYIKITSQGGDVVSALEMANTIASMDVSVEATEVCLSSCATYIWMAGKKRSISPRTIFAFHGDPVSHLFLYKKLAAHDKRIKPGPNISKNSRETIDLYARLNVDENLLYASSYARDFVCYKLVDRGDGSFQFQPGFRVAGFVPTAPFLDSYGVKVENHDLPRDQQQVEELANFYGGSNSRPEFVLATPQHSALDTERAKGLIEEHNLIEC